MKIIFITLLIVAGIISFSSCEGEGIIYDGEQTLTYFNGTSSTLEVELGSSATTEISVGVSTISSSDRTVGVSVVENGTTATPGMYNIPSTVIIPANEYFGTLTVEGIDDGLTTAGARVIIRLDGIDDGGVASTRNYTLTLREICPVEATFAVGDYNLAFVSGGIAAAGNAPALGDNITVNVSVGASSTERVFTVKCYPSFGFTNPPAPFSFSLSCENVVANGIVAPAVSGVGCGGSIAFGPSASPGSYSVSDDTTLTLIFAEDTEEICGPTGTTTYTLTKI